MGHTMSIHSQNEAVILEFGLKKPAFRIVVNTPTTHGSIGLTTGLDPAMTLGCGGYGGNITSDNISPRHLLNIKRLAYELRPAAAPRASGSQGTAAVPAAPAPGAPSPEPTLPRSPARETSTEITAAALMGQIPGLRAASAPAGPGPAGKPVDFVCEDDVRQAMREGRTILIHERTIVTPSARDAAAPARVLVEAQWPKS
jgi:hypothetical protein